jgi:hypothetical protein
MAWANLQKPATAAGAVLGGSTITQTFAALTNGSRIIVMVSCWKSAAVTCTGVADTVNTYTKDVDIVDAVSSVHASIWSAPNTSTSALTVTATISATGSSTSICIMEFSGLSTTSGSGARDGTSTASMNSGTSIVTSPAVTTTAANELAFGSINGNGDNKTFTKGATYTLGQNNSPDGNADVGTEYKDTGASSSSITADWTMTAGSGHNNALAVVYKLAAVVVGRPPQRSRQAVHRASSY